MLELATSGRAAAAKECGQRPMPEGFERELFDLIESVSLRERGSAAGFVRHLAAALQAKFGASLGLVAAAELRDEGAGLAPVEAAAAWNCLDAAAAPRWARRKLTSLRWWVQRGVGGGGAELDLRLFPLDGERRQALGFLTTAGSEADERELRFQVLGQLIRLFVERHHHRSRLDQIVTLARAQQMSLLQATLPAVAGHTAAALAIPAEEVGGDYHQVTPLSPRETALVVADAKGKGFEAAVLVTALHTALRALQETPFRIEHKVALLNRGLAEQGELRNLVSVFYGELDADGRLLYVNGSHPPPLLLRHQSGNIEELSEGGLFLGLGRETEYRLGVCQLLPGDTLVAYTDGWSELFNAEREEFGAEGLRTALRAGAGAAPAEMIARIGAACDEFRQEAPFHDDRTLLVVRRD